MRGPTLPPISGAYSAYWGGGGGGGGVRYSKGGRGPTLPPYFGGLLFLLLWGGRYSVYCGGELLCPPISVAYSVYWGAGGDPTLSTG